MRVLFFKNKKKPIYFQKSEWKKTFCLSCISHGIVYAPSSGGPHIKEYELGMKDKCLIYFVSNLRKQENSVVAQRVGVSGFHPLLFALANLNNLHRDVFFFCKIWNRETVSTGAIDKVVKFFGASDRGPRVFRTHDCLPKISSRFQTSQSIWRHRF